MRVVDLSTDPYALSHDLYVYPPKEGPPMTTSYDDDPRPSPTAEVREYDYPPAWSVLDITNGVTTEIGRFPTRARASLALVQAVIANEGDEDWCWIEDDDGLAIEWIGSTREGDSYRIEEDDS